MTQSMSVATAFPRMTRFLRRGLSILLVPIDLVRLTGLFGSLTIGFVAQSWLNYFSTFPVKPRMEFYPRRHSNSEMKWDKKNRFVIRRRVTLILLRYYCGNPDVRLGVLSAESGSPVAVTLTARQYRQMALRLGLTWLLALGLPLVGIPVVDHYTHHRDRAAAFTQDGDGLFAKQAFDRARIQYLNAIQQQPSLVAAQWGLAQCALKLKHPQEARNALERVVSLEVTHRQARAALVDIWLRQGKAEQALDHAVWAVQTDPTDVNAMVRLGKCQQVRGRLTEARQLAETSLGLSPDHPGALLLAAAAAAEDGDSAAARVFVDRAVAAIPAAELDRLVVSRILATCGDNAAAREQLEQLLAQDPTHGVAVQELAELLLANDDLDAAIRQYQKLTQVAVPDESAQIRLCELLLAANRLDEAHQVGKTLVRQMPENTAGHMVLAMVYYLKGLWLASAEHCRASLLIAPKSIPARTLLARVLMRQGKYAQAIPWLQSMRGEDWRNVDILLMLAECYVDQGNRKAAFELLDRIQTLNSIADAPYLLRARLHVAAGDRDKAFAAYRKALELNPEQPVALNNLAALLANNGSDDEAQLEEAQQLAAAAWRLRSDNPEIAETLGWIQSLRGEHASAVSLLSYASRLLPRQPQVRIHLATALVGVNHIEEARKQLDIAMGLDPAFATRKEVQSLRKKLEAAQAESPDGP